MPEAIEKELVKKANKKNLKGKRKDAYVYGTMRGMGWTPKREKRSS